MDPTTSGTTTASAARNTPKVKIPKARMYVKDHKMEFASLVRDHKNVLFGSLSSTLTMKMKEAVWDNIRAQVKFYYAKETFNTSKTFMLVY